MPAETTPAAPPSRRRALPPLGNILAVAAGGAIGGALRYALILAFPVEPGGFPWVIFFENISGAFLLGFVLTYVLDRWRLPWDIRPFLTTGVLGSFTTFSNFTVDIVQLGWQSAYATALTYSAASMGLGVAAALAGVVLGHALAGRRR